MGHIQRRAEWSSLHMFVRQFSLQREGKNETFESPVTFPRVFKDRWNREITNSTLPYLSHLSVLQAHEGSKAK